MKCRRRKGGAQERKARKHGGGGGVGVQSKISKVVRTSHPSNQTQGY